MHELRSNSVAAAVRIFMAQRSRFCFHRHMRRVIVTLFLLLACATAHAEKNPKTATLLSAVSSGISGGVVVAGFVTASNGERINDPVMYTGIGLLFVTPSLGEMYAGQYLTWGMGIRLAASGLAVYTLETQTSLAVCDTAHSSQDPPCEVFKEAAYPLLGLAAIGFIGGVWYDVLDAGDAVERYNKRHNLNVTPTVPTSSGLAPGLTLSGTF
jgi:hypothetical protein